MSRASLDCHLCRPDELRPALEALYGRIAPEWRSSVVDDALERIKIGEVDVDGLWVARRRGRIRAVFLTQKLPGRAAAVWAPMSNASLGRKALIGELVGRALDDLRQEGYRLAQALLEPSESEGRPGRDLAAAGVPRVAHLTYLDRTTADPIPLRGPTPPLEWVPFSDETEAEFRRTLDRTYVDSLDMPELETVRSIDDIIAGHADAGRFDPTRWRLGRVPGEPGAAAVILLAEVPDKPACEVAYLGLTPEARGRGLGRASLAHAVEIARPFATRLELAVDDRNVPAVKLYASAGFVRFDRRAVHLALL